MRISRELEVSLTLAVNEARRRRHEFLCVEHVLYALLHDAPEYVIGDMISPVKAAVGPGYRELDARLTAAIHTRFGLPAEIPEMIKKQIKRADALSAWLEAVQIAGFSKPEANTLFGKPVLKDLPNRILRPHAPLVVKGQFLELFSDLS